MAPENSAGYSCHRIGYAHQKRCGNGIVPIENARGCEKNDEKEREGEKSQSEGSFPFEKEPCQRNPGREQIDEKEQVIKKNNEIINQLLKKIDELKNTH